MCKYPSAKIVTNENDDSEHVYSAGRQKHVSGTSAQVSWSLITTHSRVLGRTKQEWVSEVSP